MEPRIQYAKTGDGVSIAYWTLGEGLPLVVMASPPFSHIQLEWQWPEWRRSYEHLAEKRMVVRYDGRGSGMSDRDVADLSLEAQMRDLEAVIERLGLQRFALVGYVDSGVVAIGYAVRHPERVSHLVLWGSQARGSHIRGEQTPYVPGMFALLENDWDLFVATASHVMFGLPTGDLGLQVADFIRQSTTAEAVQAAFEASSQSDVAALLPQVRSPALVLHPRQIPWLPSHLARELASGIPDAQLTLVEGLMWWGDQWEPVLAAIDDFLGEGEERETKAELPEGMAVLLFADIADSTALTERMGDAAFRAKARELDTSLRAIIRECSGTPVEGKVLGDGVLAVFTSARQAIDCALRCDAASQPLVLQLHLGIHAGDVIREENNVYGGAVNIAARISALSAPGEVLVSDTVRGLARTSAGVSFDDRGEHSLKGVSEAQRLWAVRGGGV